MGTNTTHYGLYKPADGERPGGTPSNDWAAQENANWDAIDARFFNHAVPGLEQASAYTDIAEILANDAESTTGWHAVNNDTADGNPGPSLSALHTQGSNSIQAYMKHLFNDTTASLYVNLTEAGYASGITTYPGQYFLFDVQAEAQVDVGLTNAFAGWSAFAATAVDVGGTVVNQVFTALPGIAVLDWWETGVFYTFAVPVGALTNVRSVGIRKTATGSGSGGTTYRIRWHVDNVRLSSLTPLDRAYNASGSAGAVMVPGYSTAVTQYPLQPTSSKAVLDLRKGYTGPNNVRYLREFMLDETGTIDISFEFQRILDAASPNDYFMGSPGATYRLDHPVYMRVAGVTLDGNYSTFFATRGRKNSDDDAFFNIEAADITCRRMKVLGFRDQTFPGGNMLLYAGTPTVVSTTYTLTSLADEVRNPVAISESATLKRSFAYGRDILGRQRFDFVLSDSNHIASDCQILIRDEDGTILQTTTLTLTATPTTYTVYWTPKTLWNRVTVTVRKATGSANPITITSGTHYQISGWNANAEFNDGFRVWVKQVGSPNIRQAGDRFLLEDVWIEGVGGCGFVVNTATALLAPDGVRVRRVVTCCNGFTSFDFDGGNHHSLENLLALFPGRHGMDLEPEGSTHSMRGLRMRNVRFWKTTLQAVDFGGGCRVHDVEIDGLRVDIDYAVGYFAGTTGEKIRLANMTLLRTDEPADASIPSGEAGSNSTISGRDITIENVVIDGSIGLTAFTGLDENSVSQTASGAVLRNITFRRPVAAGILKITMPGVHLDGITQLASDSGAGINPLGPVSPIWLAPDTTFRGVNLAALRFSLPKTYKGIADSDPWYPGGLNLKDDPLYGVKGISGSSVRSWNLDGIAKIRGGASSGTVVFPSPNYPDPTSFALAGTTGGTLSGTQYVRVAARTLAGPRLPLSEQSIVLGANSAVTITISGLYSIALGHQIIGWTVYVGSSPGVYDRRYDLVPSNKMPGASNTLLNQVKFTDLGTTLIGTVGALQNLGGYTFPVAVQSGSFTPVDESGWQENATYKAFMAANYATSIFIGTKRRNGFDFTLGTPGAGIEPIIAFQATPNVADTTDRTAYTTPSFTPPANSTIVMEVSGVLVPTPLVPVITDSAGLTWTQQGAFLPIGGNNSASCWTAQVGGSPSAMTITATFSALYTAAVISLYAVTHAGSVLQVASASGATGNPLVTLPNGPAESSVSIAFSVALNAQAATGAWTRDADSVASPAVLDCFSTLTPSQSFTTTGTGSVWGAHLLEIAADSTVTSQADWLVAQ